MSRIKSLLSAFVMSFASVVLLAAPASAAELNVNCADLAQAITNASSGDVLKITGDCTLTNSITVDKSLTLDGEGGATISTSGTNKILIITADNVTVRDLEFIKTDKANQNIIGVQGENVTLANNAFSGQYTLEENDHTSRAIEVSTTSGLMIDNNSFVNIRQPAYINDNTTGIISNNYVDATRGWVVVANTDIDFTGNSWGTNAVDIAIIPGTPNNYPCNVLNQIIKDNNQANVENQALTESCPEPAYPENKEECKDDGWQVGLADREFKNQGDCVSHFASNEKTKGNPVVNFFRSLFNR